MQSTRRTRSAGVLLATVAVIGSVSVPALAAHADENEVVVTTPAEVVAAFASAPSGTVVRLGADITASTAGAVTTTLAVPDQVALTIDLDGHALDVAAAGDAAISVGSSAKLNVEDSTEAGGVLDVRNTGSGSGIDGDGGVVELDGGRVSVTGGLGADGGPRGDDGGPGVRAGTLVINGADATVSGGAGHEGTTTGGTGGAGVLLHGGVLVVRGTIQATGGQGGSGGTRGGDGGTGIGGNLGDGAEGGFTTIGGVTSVAGGAGGAGGAGDGTGGVGLGSLRSDDGPGSFQAQVDSGTVTASGGSSGGAPISLDVADDLSVEASGALVLEGDAASSVARAARFSVAGDLVSTADLSVAGDLDVSGTMRSDGDLDVTGTMELDGTLHSRGAVAVAGNIRVGGTLQNDHEVRVDGTMDLSGTVRNNGSVTGDGTITNSGRITRPGTVTTKVVTGNTYGLSFAAGPGSAAVDDQHVYAATVGAAEAVLPVPQRDGFLFTGWQTAGGAVLDATTPLAQAADGRGVVQLTAGWSALAATGRPVEGTELVGSLTPAAPSAQFAWALDGDPVDGATDAVWRVGEGAADLPGRIVSVQASLQLPAGYAAATAAATAVVGPAVGRFVDSGVTISGVPGVGSVLTADTGSWRPSATFTYRWLRDGAPIAGADGVQYRATQDDFDHELTVEATGSAVDHETTTVTSPSVQVVAGAPATLVLTTTGGTVRPDGTVRIRADEPLAVTAVLRDEAGNPAAGADGIRVASSDAADRVRGGTVMFGSLGRRVLTVAAGGLTSTLAVDVTAAPVPVPAPAPGAVGGPGTTPSSAASAASAASVLASTGWAVSPLLPIGAGSAVVLGGLLLVLRRRLQR